MLPRPARISHTVHFQNLGLLGLVGLLSGVSGVRVRTRVSVRIGVRFSFSANWSRTKETRSGVVIWDGVTLSVLPNLMFQLFS